MNTWQQKILKRSVDISCNYAFRKNIDLLGCMINADRHIPPKTMHITSIESRIPFH